MMRMSMKRFLSLAAMLGLGAWVAPARGEVVLSNNLGKPVADFEQLTDPEHWVASSFATTATADTVLSVTLLMDRYSSDGVAELDIYTDSSDAPGTLVAALTPPGSYSSALEETTFTAPGGGLPLAPSTTYWVVLKALNGDFDWAWTESSQGSGPGFQHTWSSTYDSGATWLTFHEEPMLMKVTAAGIQAVPEPSTLALGGVGLLAGLTVAGRRRRRAA